MEIKRDEEHGLSALTTTPVSTKVGEVADFQDIGAAAFAEAANYCPDTLEADKASVRKKLDKFLMPMLMLSFTFQYLDKLSLNYGSAYSLIEDLELTGQRYSTVASAFSYGNIAWYLPACFLVQRLPVAKYCGGMMLVWSILLLCSAAAKNFGSIFALRFILGMAEANMTPAYMSICSMFYTRQELPLRVFLFVAMNGISTAIGSLIAFGLGHATGSSVDPWQLIFMVIGSVNCIWAFLFLYLVPDSPMTTRWLSATERVVAVARVSENMIGIKEESFKPHQIKEALMDPKFWILCLSGFCNGVVSGGLGNFASALIKGFGFSGLNATLLQLPTGIAEFICLPVAGWFATRYKDTRCIVYIVFSLIPAGGFFGIRFTSIDHHWRLVGSTWLLSIYAVGAAMSYSLLATNFAGHSKRSFVNGMWFVTWASGSVAGANFFRAEDAPRYLHALDGLVVCTFVGLFLILILRQYMWWENKRRDRIYGAREVTAWAADDEAIRAGFNGETDIENKHFRYAL